MISIIIAAYNNFHFANTCIASVMKHCNEEFEYILIDDASNDETWQLMRYNIKYHWNEYRQGIVKNRNIGIDLAQGEFIIFLDSDTFVADDTLNRMVNYLKRDANIGIIGPFGTNVQSHQNINTIEPEMVLHDTSPLNMASNIVSKLLLKYEKMPPIDTEYTLIGFCTAARKSFYEIVGKFDEKCHWCEDVDMSLHARLYGFRTCIARDCFVYHYNSSTAPKTRVEEGKKGLEYLNRKWNLYA